MHTWQHSTTPPFPWQIKEFTDTSDFLHTRAAALRPCTVSGRYQPCPAGAFQADGGAGRSLDPTCARQCLLRLDTPQAQRQRGKRRSAPRSSPAPPGAVFSWAEPPQPPVVFGLSARVPCRSAGRRERGSEQRVGHLPAAERRGPCTPQTPGAGAQQRRNARQGEDDSRLSALGPLGGAGTAGRRGTRPIAARAPLSLPRQAEQAAGATPQ